MEKNILVCSECAGILTEPLCISCFEKEVKSWLRDQIPSQNLPLIKEEFNSMIKLTSFLPISSMKCIVCAKYMQNICNHCLIKETAGIIKQYISDEEAFMIFNYASHDFGFQRN